MKRFPLSNVNNWNQPLGAVELTDEALEMIESHLPNVDFSISYGVDPVTNTKRLMGFAIVPLPVVGG